MTVGKLILVLEKKNNKKKNHKTFDPNFDNELFHQSSGVDPTKLYFSGFPIFAVKLESL